MPTSPADLRSQQHPPFYYVTFSRQDTESSVLNVAETEEEARREGVAGHLWRLKRGEDGIFDDDKYLGMVKGKWP